MNTAAHRYQERERLINNDEFSTGFSTSENYCARLKKHIEKMKSLGGDHSKDISTYEQYMKEAKNGKGCPSSGGRRASKHSKKHRKSRKTKSRKSRKSNKSRRH